MYWGTLFQGICMSGEREREREGREREREGGRPWHEPIGLPFGGWNCDANLNFAINCINCKYKVVLGVYICGADYTCTYISMLVIFSQNSEARTFRCLIIETCLIHFTVTVPRILKMNMLILNMTLIFVVCCRSTAVIMIRVYTLPR